jgi:alpha-amylase
MFGGVYLQFLRFAVYTHLIKAEKLIDEINSFLYPAQKADISFTPLDFNKDSRMDIIIESKLINTYINPADGGTIFELDYKPESYNLLNTLTRWSEAYHDSDKIDVKELKVDRFRRSMLRMRFMHKDTSL